VAFDPFGGFVGCRCPIFRNPANATTKSAIKNGLEIKRCAAPLAKTTTRRRRP
jgi:hypothetical protein